MMLSFKGLREDFAKTAKKPEESVSVLSTPDFKTMMWFATEIL